MADDVAGFRKVRAKELGSSKREELRKALQHDLTEALIRSIKTEPSELDLSSVTLILKPGQKIADWTVVADCGTCATCNTCATCRTCSTNALPKDVPPKVIKDLKIKSGKPQL
jgi:hypothetical protein